MCFGPVLISLHILRMQNASVVSEMPGGLIKFRSNRLMQLEINPRGKSPEGRDGPNSREVELVSTAAGGLHSSLTHSQ